MKLFGEGGGLIDSVRMSDLGNNGVQTLMIGVESVGHMVVKLPGSGALSSLVLCPALGLRGSTVAIDSVR